MDGTHVSASGGRVTFTDGPYAEAKETIVSFALVDVRSKEEAIELSRRFWQHRRRRRGRHPPGVRPGVLSGDPTRAPRSRRSGGWSRRRIVAALARLVRDVGLAEELAQDALVAALEEWPARGVPANPAGWLMTTAKHRAIDRLRRNDRLAVKVAELGRRRGRQRGTAGPTSTRCWTTTSSTTTCSG